MKREQQKQKQRANSEVASSVLLPSSQAAIKQHETISIVGGSVDSSWDEFPDKSPIQADVSKSLKRQSLNDEKTVEVELEPAEECLLFPSPEILPHPTHFTVSVNPVLKRSADDSSAFTPRSSSRASNKWLTHQKTIQPNLVRTSPYKQLPTVQDKQSVSVFSKKAHQKLTRTYRNLNCGWLEVCSIFISLIFMSILVSISKNLFLSLNIPDEIPDVLVSLSYSMQS